MHLKLARLGGVIVVVVAAWFLTLTPIAPIATAQPATLSIDNSSGNPQCAQTLTAPNVLPCGYAELTGTVSAEDTGLPVSNVLVEFISNDANSLGASGVTDVNGHYSAFLYAPSSVVPRLMTLNINTSFTPYQDYAPPSIIQVYSGTFTTINAVLKRGATFTGVVTATDSGLPLTNTVAVSAYYQNSSGLKIGREGSTDAQGHYRIQGLSAGAYTLKFTPQGDAVDYMVTYSGGVLQESAATKITVTVPLTTQVNISLTRGVQIYGMVTTGDTGEPVSNASVYLFTENNVPITDRFTGSFDTGLYYLRGLVPGRYKLGFAPPLGLDLLRRFYGGATSFAAASVISATGEISADIALPRGATITGTVRDGVTSAPISNVTVDAGNVITTPSDLDKIALPGLYAYSDATGAYSIVGLESGTYNLALTPDFFSIYLAQHVLSVTVTAPLTKTNVNATLNEGGRVSGRIVDTHGVPIDLVSVTVEKVGGGSEGSHTLAYAATDASGYYTTTGGLVPGSYTVHFNRGGPCLACYNDQYYNSQPGQTTPEPVPVLAGQVTPNLNATLACNPPPLGRKMYLPFVAR